MHAVKQTVQIADIESILSMVRQWVCLVSRQDFVSASDYLTPVPGAETVYSPNLIREAVGRYSWEYRQADPSIRDQFLPRVSDPMLIDRSGENLVIYCGPKASRGIAFLEYDLPIDEKWSDLTAAFFLLGVAGGFGLGLHDLHVL
jgi:hypothetical protein